jgi:hypothetical protein
MIPGPIIYTPETFCLFRKGARESIPIRELKIKRGEDR